MSETLVDIIRNLRGSNTNTISATALLAYDILITFGQEFEFIWCSSWSLVKSVYLFTRYYPLAFLLANAFVLTRNDMPAENVTVAARVSITFKYGRGAATLWPLTGALIVVRIFALYDRNKKAVGLFVGSIALIPPSYARAFASHFCPLQSVFAMMGKTWQPINGPGLHLPERLLKSTGCVNPLSPNFGLMFAFFDICRNDHEKILAIRSLVWVLDDPATHRILQNICLRFCGIIRRRIIACRMVLNIRDIATPSQYDRSTTVLTSGHGELHPMNFLRPKSGQNIEDSGVEEVV
ncbi:hypothetical protein BU17DRAFT_69690 [Hysterangium stoloniferum]|nr:hypothetical protein BU17DRAFT_69690 [Hysterangium stoloniferum]